MHRFLVIALGLIGVFSDSYAQSVSVQEVAADRRLWPVQVTVRVPVKVATLVAGKPTGSIEVPAGRLFRVVRVEPTRLLLDFSGSQAVVSPSDTDLLELATARKAQLAAAPPPATPAPATPRPVAAPPSLQQGVIAKAIASDLVALDGDQVKPVPGAALDPVKYYAFYFSASWCGPCRRFTPQLAAFYRELKPKHPEFELVFVSSDRSEPEMERYMKEAGMPWPALEFRSIRSNRTVTKHAGPGIPCLVLVDADGKVLSHSYDGETYVGPSKVVKDIAQLLQKKS